MSNWAKRGAVGLLLVSAAGVAPACGSTPHAHGSAKGAEGGAAGEAGTVIVGGSSGADNTGAGAGGEGEEFERGEPIPLAEVWEPYLEAYCEWLTRCGQAIAYEQLPGGCFEAFAVDTQRDFADVASMIDQGLFTYTPTLAHACIEARRNERCDTYNLPPACVATFDGTVQLGGACSGAGECAGNATCSGCPGHCSVGGGLGEACDRAQPCDFTHFSCSRGECRPLVREGEACTYGPKPILCGGGEPCQTLDSETEGVCQAYRAAKLGEVCGLADGVFCEAGAACAVTKVTNGLREETCVARADSGGACARGFQDSCPAGEFCDLSSEDQGAGKLTGECRPLAKVGERCPTAYACEAGATCQLLHRCVKLAELGEPCLEGGECRSLICSAGLCAEYDHCTEPDPYTPSRLHDPERPVETCPTQTPGELVEGFDTAESVASWDQSDPGTGARVLDWSADERFSCSGALHVHATFTASSQFVFALASPIESLWDWSPYKRLHFWIRLASPGVGDSEDLLSIEPIVSGATSHWRAYSLDGSWLRDFEWHELMVDLTPPGANQVDGFGLYLSVSDALTTLPSSTLDVDVYLDDFWLE